MRILIAKAASIIPGLIEHDDWAADYLGFLMAPDSNRKATYAMAERLHLPYYADNGAFGGLKHAPFLKMLATLVEKEPQWVVAPDCVGNARKTDALFDIWEPVYRDLGFHVAYVAQDGATIDSIPWRRLECLFVGGQDPWKESAVVNGLVIHAKALGKAVHVGRVNTVGRLQWCLATGAVDSIDGTGITIYTETYLPKFLGIIKRHLTQPMFWERPHDNTTDNITTRP